MQQTLQERTRVAGLPASRADIIPTALSTIEALLKYANDDECQPSYYNLHCGLLPSYPIKLSNPDSSPL